MNLGGRLHWENLLALVGRAPTILPLLCDARLLIFRKLMPCVAGGLESSEAPGRTAKGCEASPGLANTPAPATPRGLFNLKINKRLLVET